MSPAAPSTAARSPASASTKAARIYYEVETRLPHLGQRLRRPRLRAGPGVRQPRRHRRHHRGRLHAGPRAPSRPRRWPPTRRPRPRPRRRAGRLRRQPGAPEPLLRRHGELARQRRQLVRGGTRRVWGFDDDYAHSGDISLRGADARDAAGTRSLDAGPERRAPGGRDVVVPALRSRVRVRATSGTTQTLRRRRARVQHQRRRRRTRTSARSAGRRRLQRQHRSPALGNPLAGRAAFVSESNGYRATPREPELLGGPERALPLDASAPTTRARAPAGSSTTSASTRACRTPTATASRTTPTPARPWRGRRTAARRPPVAAAGRPRRRVAAPEGRRRQHGDAQEREAAAPARSAARARSCG